MWKWSLRFHYFYVLLLIVLSGVNHVSSLDDCSQVETFPPAVVTPPKAPQLWLREPLPLPCCITFIKQQAGSFSVMPASMTLPLTSPSLFFPLICCEDWGEAETEGENREILGAWNVFFNLLFSRIGTGGSSVGIKKQTEWWSSALTLRSAEDWRREEEKQNKSSMWNERGNERRIVRMCVCETDNGMWWGVEEWRCWPVSGSLWGRELAKSWNMTLEIWS